MRFIFNLVKRIFWRIIHTVNWLFDDSGRSKKARTNQGRNIDIVNTSRMKRDGRIVSKWDIWHL